MYDMENVRLIHFSIDENKELQSIVKYVAELYNHLLQTVWHQ